MTSAQSRLDSAILAHEQATAEVEKLCDILEKAVDALAKARQTKRDAQKDLDEAAAALSQPRSSGRAHQSGIVQRLMNNAEYFPKYKHENGAVGDTSEDPSEYSPEESETSSEEGESEEEDDDEEEEDGFDMGNEALEQIRYRLETAKIDPNSPDGTALLDKLLIRLQDANETVVDAHLINNLIDRFLFESEEQEAAAPQAADQNSRKPPPPLGHLEIRIHRGGKILGYYQGELDKGGYARQGAGSMYYDAGHECHGTWQNDEMIGRGVYKWSDGHVYDGEWLNGKRHGLGRFIRPDNVVLFGRYERGHHKGEGARWSADRREAQVVVDGVPKKTVSLAKAKEIVTNLGFDDVLPPPV